MDYTALYNDFWSQPERVGTTSFANAGDLAEGIIFTCGRGEILDVGCGEGALVGALLVRGVDAVGIDPSAPAVKRANLRAPGRFRQGSILALPYADNAFETVVCTDVLEHLTPEDVPQALAELRRVSVRSVFLTVSTRIDMDGLWHLTVENRLWWENACLRTGFRFHPRELHIVPFISRERQGDNATIILEKIPDASLRTFPLEGPTEEKEPHKDMLRVAGRRGEAFRQRYHAASAHIRRGDTVLDLACGHGYGSHMLYHNSQAKRVVGIDADEDAVMYAGASYSEDDAIRFQTNEPHVLDFLPDNSADFVTAFDLLEKFTDPASCLREIHRVLRPSGRVAINVPGIWPRERLLREMSAVFLVERIAAQNAGNGDMAGFRRNWTEAEPDSPLPHPAEWVLCLAMKNPSEGKGVPYVPRDDVPPANWPFKDFAFARDMENPWLYYGMTHRTERLQNPAGLAAMRDTVLRSSPDDSMDYAAALCGQAYDCLENGTGDGRAEVLIEAIQGWLGRARQTPAALRWKVSLLYASGLLRQARGQLEQAEEDFTACAGYDVLEYTPTLGTKTVSALHNAALLALGRGDEAASRGFLQRAVAEPWRLLAGGGPTVTGGPEHPLWWSLVDMREILHTASQCLKLLYEMDSAKSRPGLWASLVSEIDGWNNLPPAWLFLDSGLQDCGRRLSGRDVYFWGCGQVYDLCKHLFTGCKPRCFLVDLPGGRDTHEGIPVRHPDDVLPHGDKLPIVVFSGNPPPVAQTIATKYPQYGADDVIFCVPLEYPVSPNEEGGGG
ncbi:MAG: Ubiquinone biosynthesis O-methyltransferase, mitochondrial [Desulfovibrio sp.]